jgi:hypothetical protein
MNQDVSGALLAIFDEFRSRKETLSPRMLAARISELHFSLSASDVAEVGKLIGRFLGGRGVVPVPSLLLPVIAALIQDRHDKVICDPWAGIGTILAVSQETTKAKTPIAIVQNEADFELGRELVKSAEWRIGDPLDLLAAQGPELDLVVSIPPFGAKTGRTLTVRGPDGADVELHDDLGNLILAASAAKLNDDGIGVYVVTPSFFFSSHSVLRRFGAVGLAVEAALALPPGSFAPYTNIQSYLVVVRRRVTDRMFVGQLSNDAKSNLQIVSNFKQGKAGGALELGRYVDAQGFGGLDSIRMAERLEESGRTFGAPAICLGDVALAITLGRSGPDYHFPAAANALFVPLIGISDVLDSQDDMTLKAQNYAQVVIDPERSQARFVAQFLNSDLGKEIRESNKAGAVIPKLNTQSLKNLSVFLPSLQSQKSMLEVETRIAAERNTLLGLQNELSQLKRELWSNPQATDSVGKQLSVFSDRLSGSLKQHAASDLDHWIETLPFPIASILRAWQATPSQDFKTKYEHLLHFFEATTEFIGVILLSAFASNEGLFGPHKRKLSEAMGKVNLSFQRATFGTWKFVVEYFGKQTRELVGGNQENNQALCAEIFADASLELPRALSRVELAGILSSTNKMRNDWSGHGGVVGQEEAQLRNEQLVGELQKIRDVVSDTWTWAQLIRALHTVHRRGVFENEVAVLMGSNSEFLKETRSMAISMDVERIYVSSGRATQALKLLPLVQMGSSPQSAKNACYFFSRLERDGARFVSYHYAEEPELKGQFDDATAAIRFLTEV